MRDARITERIIGDILIFWMSDTSCDSFDEKMNDHGAKFARKMGYELLSDMPEYTHALRILDDMLTRQWSLSEWRKIGIEEEDE